MLLTVMPWGRAKPAGLSDKEVFHDLWRYLGPNWLASSQQNDMLALLRNKILTCSKPEHPIHVESTQLTQKLLVAFNVGKSLGAPSGLTLTNQLILDRPPDGIKIACSEKRSLIREPFQA